MSHAQRILVAYDGSSNSKQALEKATEYMAADKNVETHVVFVTHPPHMDLYSLYGVSMSQEVLQKMAEANEKVLAEAKEKVADYTDSCRFVQLEGDASEQIIDYAHDNEMDLIIIGSRGLGAFKGMLLGSVSYRVVQAAECDVMIIK